MEIISPRTIDEPTAAERYGHQGHREGMNTSRDKAQHAARTRLLHVLIRQHEMDDADYRNWLQALTGHTSSKQCSLQQLSECIDRLKGVTHAAPTTKSPTAPAGLERQFAKIAALLAAQGKPWSYAEAIARRMYRKEVMQFCTGEELRGVIAALERAGQRSTAQKHAFGKA